MNSADLDLGAARDACVRGRRKDLDRSVVRESDGAAHGGADADRDERATPDEIAQCGRPPALSATEGGEDPECHGGTDDAQPEAHEELSEDISLQRDA